MTEQPEESHLNLPSRLHINPKTMQQLRAADDAVQAMLEILNMMNPKPSVPTGSADVFSSMVKQTSSSLEEWKKHKRAHFLTQNP